MLGCCVVLARNPTHDGLRWRVVRMATIVSIAVTLFTTPKPVSELQGLVYGMANAPEDAGRKHTWWESPKLLGFTALALAAILTIIFF